MNTPRPHDSPTTATIKVKHLGRFLIEEPAATSSIQLPTVIAYFKSRWGEVDGYLPILHKFKETHPNWRIIAIIGSERLANTVEAQPLLYNELQQIVDVLIRRAPKIPNTSKQIFYRKWIRKTASWYHRKCVRLSWRPVFNYLRNESIELIMKDHGHDDQFLLQLQSRFPAKCVSSPHGTGIYLQNEDQRHLKPQNAKVDLLLAGDESEVPIFRIFTGAQNSVNIQAVGRPRYDRWWIEHLTQLPSFESSKEYQLAQQSQRVFLFATRGPSSSFFPTSVFEYLVKTVAETVLSQPGSLLLIKPHPQQDLEPIKSIMAQYDSSRWKISSLQTMQLAHLSDFVICMLSGVILDALAVGKPTVEYFQYTKKLQCFFQNENGKTVSVYGKLGLAVTAERQEELEALIDDYFSNSPRSNQWEQQHSQAARFMKLDNQSSIHSVKAIERLLETKQTHQIS